MFQVMTTSVVIITLLVVLGADAKTKAQLRKELHAHLDKAATKIAEERSALDAEKNAEAVANLDAEAKIVADLIDDGGLLVHRARELAEAAYSESASMAHLRAAMGPRAVGVMEVLARPIHRMVPTGLKQWAKDDDYAFDLGPNGDLFCIKKRGTTSKSTEVHVLSRMSKYKQFVLQTGTALHETDGDYSFDVASNGDLFAFKRRGGEGQKTEVRVLSAASGYKEFVLEVATPLPEVEDDWTLKVAGNRDIVAIDRTTSVYVYSAASEYKVATEEALTALGNSTGDEWHFDIAPNSDLFAILAPKNSVNAEVYVLSSDSRYQMLIKHDKTDYLPLFGSYWFAVSANRKVVSVHRTGARRTDVHTFHHEVNILADEL